MQVAVQGAGAVGIALASALAAAGLRVALIARPTAAAEIRARGLTRVGLFGRHHVAPSELDLLTSPSELLERGCDWLLVCTKTFHTPQVAAALAPVWPALAERCRCVLFHNGWGSAEELARTLPRERVFSARVITGFRRLDACTSEVTVHQDAIRMGSLFGADPEHLAPLAACIARGGIPCEVTSDVESELLAKLLYSCALNPLGALRGVPYGALAESAHTRAIMADVVREIFSTLGAAGLATHWTDADAYLRDFYTRILPPTAAHESSMLQDLRAGRRTEIDALCGAVVALSTRHGVDVPVNAALRTLVRGAEATAARRHGRELRT